METVVYDICSRCGHTWGFHAVRPSDQKSGTGYCRKVDECSCLEFVKQQGPHDPTLASIEYAMTCAAFAVLPSGNKAIPLHDAITVAVQLLAAVTRERDEARSMAIDQQSYARAITASSERVAKLEAAARALLDQLDREGNTRDPHEWRIVVRALYDALASRSGGDAEASEHEPGCRRDNDGPVPCCDFGAQQKEGGNVVDEFSADRLKAFAAMTPGGDNLWKRRSVKMARQLLIERERHWKEIEAAEARLANLRGLAFGAPCSDDKTELCTIDNPTCALHVAAGDAK